MAKLTLSLSFSRSLSFQRTKDGIKSFVNFMFKTTIMKINSSNAASNGIELNDELNCKFLLFPWQSKKKRVVY